jgi:hypothetical protein
MRAIMALCCFLAPIWPARGQAPSRVVSLNLCTDQWLVLLATERAGHFIAAIDAALPPPHSATVSPIRALVWEPRSWTSGPGTLMDAVVRAAGMVDTGSGGWVVWRHCCAIRPICWFAGSRSRCLAGNRDAAASCGAKHPGTHHPDGSDDLSGSVHGRSCGSAFGLTEWLRTTNYIVLPCDGVAQ